MYSRRGLTAASRLRVQLTRPHVATLEPLGQPQSVPPSDAMENSLEALTRSTPSRRPGHDERQTKHDSSDPPPVSPCPKLRQLCHDP
ncbi:hypothetical protein N7532_003976 [Penicillium argentinense]|uniref:Uncharacterized protein n=1 Tax=Penicillium argentinense TaxID=1131581 RepID=A0A9W9FNZ6_9EURO|nr:uncharacterized protein N7532_003976 [Penicillium argentinense]KAJ5103447.1 hypothetical protein N7532_003976 [Penicillium argentinense]